MKLCPYCAEEIQDAAIRCKHCRSDLALAPAAPGASPPRAPRLLLALAAVAAVGAATPVLTRPLLQHWRAQRCRPSSWTEWHTAMIRQCLTPAYVCEHMTTGQMLRDPDVGRVFDGDPGPQLADMVGRVRNLFGCAPESGRAVHPAPGPIAPPPFTVQQDAPRSL